MTWTTKKLGELITIKHGFAFLGKYFANTGSHIVLTPGNFYDKGGFRRRIEKDKWYTGKIPSEYILEKGDLIIAMTEQGEGLLGSSAIVPISKLYLHNQRLGLVHGIKKEKVDMPFFYYLFNLSKVRKQIRGTASGTKVRHTSPGRIYEISVKIPDLPTQTRIASVLSSYDDLIENNEKRIKALEEMAQLLYTEWFVRFQFPGHEGVKMVESGTEYGEVPEGWEVKTVDDLYKTSSGGTPSRQNEVEFYLDGFISWIKTKELNDSYILDAEEKITKIAVEKSSAKIFPKNTVLIAMYGATIGRLGILSSESATNQACCAFLLRKEEYSSYYIFQFLKNSIEKITSLAFGAAQPNVSQNTIKNLAILKPQEDVLNLYNKKVEIIFNELLSLQKQNQNLSKTRDLLIPQLVTGRWELAFN